jgi:hypothetical protein
MVVVVMDQEMETLLLVEYQVLVVQVELVSTVLLL